MEKRTQKRAKNTALSHFTYYTVYWQFDFLAHLDWQSGHLCAADVGNEKEATARKAKIRLHIVLVFS